MQKIYNTAVFGSTFLGLGAALCLENTIVIEKGGLFGAEFINSYNVCKQQIVSLKTELGREFFENLKRRGLVSVEGEIYPAPVVYVLSSYLKRKALDILLMTTVVSIKWIDSFYEIIVCHSGGLETIYAKRILDTTTMGILHNASEKCGKKKYINAIIYNPDGNTMDGISFNSLNEVYTYTFPLELTTCRYDAVEQLCGMENLLAEHNMRISSIASDFAYSMEPCLENVEEHFIWNPSCGYSNLMEAFDKGVEFAEEMLK